VSAAREPLPRLVVLGCGFGGYSLLRALQGGRYVTTLVSPRNYFLFTPLLPSAVTGTVEFRSIVEPARRKLREVRLVEGHAVGVDWERRVVACESAIGALPFELPFDQLVVAVGSEVADYGVPGVREHAVSLASIEDARTIRRRILEQFARAGVPGIGETERRAALTVAVCGGGPTGVEAAAEIHDLLEEELAAAYPDLAPQARVVLVEAGERLLSTFDAALGEYTSRHFAREGIELRMRTPVRRIGADGIELAGGEWLPAGLVVWTAGSVPSPFVETLGVELDARGRIRTAATLRVGSRPGLWALGDCAAVGEPPLPATAQVAQQQGPALARNLARVARGEEPRPFRFRKLGMLAYIGERHALADLPSAKWSGRGAWLFWRGAYLTKLVSLANKAKVLFDWIKARLFGRDLARF
jgi:NADH:ubiquinone reductase (non-electrogenic)